MIFIYIYIYIYIYVSPRTLYGLVYNLNSRSVQYVCISPSCVPSISLDTYGQISITTCGNYHDMAWTSQCLGRGLTTGSKVLFSIVTVIGTIRMRRVNSIIDYYMLQVRKMAKSHCYCPMLLIQTSKTARILE